MPGGEHQLDVAILGAGAAGMMAAVAAGEGLQGTRGGRRIAIFEKNRQPGIKVLVCGGGRCNFTNAGSVDFLIGQFGRNGRFLTLALRHLDNEALRAFFADLGVPSHVEHDGKVYPDSNQARSVVDALVRRMRGLAVGIFAGTEHAAASIDRLADRFRITHAGGTVTEAAIVLLAVGGMSYQRMGTVGDGYRMAAALGHSIVTPRPAIVGLLVEEDWARELQGLAVRDVEVRIAVQGSSSLARLATGKPGPSINDLLFTHFGLSGPAVLNPSEIVAELLEKGSVVSLLVDFARHVTHEEAHALLRHWQQQEGKKRIKTMLSQGQPDKVELISATSPDQTWSTPGLAAAPSAVKLSLPVRLAERICMLEQVPPDQICASLSSAQIHRLVERIKHCRFTVTATLGFKEAMVTAGGVKLSEVDPRTMESRIVPNLFLTGEVLDLTGPSGGYNLQLAFSTGHLAGSEIASRLKTT